ncbi:MAG: serine hydrolase domain-containing protein [Spirochaetales bacterium]
MTRLRWAVLLFGIAVFVAGCATGPDDAATEQEQRPAEATVEETAPGTYEGEGFSTVVPPEWQEVDTGVFVESGAGNVILVVQPAPGATPDQVLQGLLPQLALTEAPEVDQELSSNGLDWSLYFITVEQADAEVALALTAEDDSTYLVLLQTPIGRDEELREVFTTAVESFSTGDRNVLSFDGLYTVPIPTNWATERVGNSYVRLYSPDSLVEFFIVVNQADVSDAESAAQVVADAWALVGADGDLPELDEVVTPPSEAGVDATYQLGYLTAPDAARIHQAQLQRVGDTNYIQMLYAEVDEATRRSAQIGVVATGLTISAVDEVDLSTMAPAAFEGALVEEWLEFVEWVQMESEIPGMAIAVVQGDEIVYQAGLGTRELGTELPVTPDTMFAIASTTKTLTTATMAALVDDGRISWDTRAVEAWDEFALSDPQITERVTLENLVSASVGVERRDLELFFGLDATPREFIEALAGFQLFTDFGEAFQYSNQMIAAGGYLTAMATGASDDSMREAYLDLVREQVLSPVGMNDTTFSLDSAERYRELATPHSVDLNTVEVIGIPIELERAIEISGPAGGAFSTLADMTRYLQMYMRGGVSESGEQVISSEGLNRLWTPQIDVSADTSYGLGWFVSDYKGLQTYGHAGNAVGYTSEFLFAPEAELGIVILSNIRAANPAHDVIVQRFFELVYAQPDESTGEFEFLIERGEAGEEELAEQTVSLSARAARRRQGTYVNEELGAIILGLDSENTATIEVGPLAMQYVRYENPGVRDGTMIITTPPLAGLPFEFNADENVVLDYNGTDFVFMKQ